jgi:hypothetical protein
MAFTAMYLPVQRDKYFTFFATDGDGAAPPDATFTENFAQSGAIELEKIRLHLSVPHDSAVDFVVTLNHHLSYVYDQKLISKAMVGIQDYEHRFNPTLKLHSADVLRFSLIMSLANTYGLEVSGWMVTRPPGDY